LATIPAATALWEKYCVLPQDFHKRDVTWTAYDAQGHLLGSGSVSKLVGQ
jgi:hypothetical protein